MAVQHQAFIPFAKVDLDDIDLIGEILGQDHIPDIHGLRMKDGQKLLMKKKYQKPRLKKLLK